MVGEERLPLVVLHLQHEGHGPVCVVVPPLHGPRHVEAHPARLRGLDHLGVQHDHLVAVAGPGPFAGVVQLELRHRNADLLVRLAGPVTAQLVQPQLGGVDGDLGVRAAGRELDFVELRGDVRDVGQLGQQRVTVIACSGFWWSSYNVLQSYMWGRSSAPSPCSEWRGRRGRGWWWGAGGPRAAR